MPVVSQKPAIPSTDPASLLPTTQAQTSTNDGTTITQPNVPQNPPVKIEGEVLTDRGDEAEIELIHFIPPFKEGERILVSDFNKVGVDIKRLESLGAIKVLKDSAYSADPAPQQPPPAVGPAGNSKRVR